MNARALLLAAGFALAGPAALAQAPAAPAAPEMTTGSVTGSAGAASNLRQMSVEAIEDMDLVAVDGKEIGEIEGVMESGDGRRFLIVERGGFLGVGAKEIAIPFENLALQGDRLVLRNMDMAALDAMPAFKNEGNAYRELDEEQQVGLAQQ